MSKTTEIQIEKSRNLIEGLRRHVREMGERGVSNNEIDQMEKTVALLSEANAEVDHLREELTPKVKKMNELMTSDAFVTTQNFTNETLPRLAYIMLLEGNEKIGDIFSKLNENSYLAWLMTINQDELLDVTGEVMDLWQSGAKTHSKPKN